MIDNTTLNTSADGLEEDIFERDWFSDEPVIDRRPFVRPLYYGQVHKYLENLERSLGKALSDHPDRQKQFDDLWAPCVRHATFNEVYEDVEDHCNHFYSSLLDTIYYEESLGLNSSITKNNVLDENVMFSQVEDVFEDSPEFYDLSSSTDHLPSSSDYLLDDLEEEDVYISLNSYIYKNNVSDENVMFSQVRGRKWELGTDFYSDESMLHQIEYRCKKVKAPYDSMEDMIAEAFVQYAEMKAEGVITGEKSAAYYAQSAVNKMINKYKYDNRQKRRSVDTVSLTEPSYVDIEDDYGSFEEWYEGLTKSQKAAVNDAKYKLEKGRPRGNALTQRLRRVPKPAIGTTVQRFGSTNLREEYSYMRKDEQPEPREVTVVSEPVAKKTVKPNKLREMIQNGVSNRDLLIAIPASLEQISEPQTVSEGKDMGMEIQSPTVANMNDLRQQWRELLEDQLSIDIRELEDYQVKYKLDYYEGCLIIPQEFQRKLQDLGIDTSNYKEIHKACSDMKKEMNEVV